MEIARLIRQMIDAKQQEEQAEAKAAVQAVPRRSSFNKDSKENKEKEKPKVEEKADGAKKVRGKSVENYETAGETEPQGRRRAGLRDKLAVFLSRLLDCFF